MSAPAWGLEILGAVLLLVAEVSAGQLVVARAWTRRGGAGASPAVARLLTGIAIAGVLVPGLRALPNAAWEAVFAVLTAWFAWCLWREGRGRGAVGGARGRYAPSLVHSAAVLYLFAALAGPSAEGAGTSVSGADGMPGMSAEPVGGSTGGLPTGGLSTLHAPAVALIFALLVVAFTLHDLDRQAGVNGYFAVAGRPFGPAGPALAAAAAGPAAAGPTVTVPTAERLLLSPAVAKGCQVATGVTIAIALIMMI
jgi:hypothetical protein